MGRPPKPKPHQKHTEDQTNPDGFYPIEIYTDGGVVGQPSSVGGVFAYVIVEKDHDGREYFNGSVGFIPCNGQYDCAQTDIEAIAGKRPISNETPEIITNNDTELLGLSRVFIEEGQSLFNEKRPIRVSSDSTFALGQVLRGNKWVKENTGHFAQYDRDRARDITAMGPELTYRLLAGHPSVDDLKAGIRLDEKPNYPVSKWNHLCDQLCGEMKEAFGRYTGEHCFVNFGYRSFTIELPHFLMPRHLGGGVFESMEEALERARTAFHKRNNTTTNQMTTREYEQAIYGIQKGEIPLGFTFIGNPKPAPPRKPRVKK